MKKYKGYIYIFLTALCFSTQEITGKYLALDHLNAYQINSITFLIGAIILLPMALRDIKRNHLKLTAKDWGYLLILGLVQVTIGMSLLQEALLFTTPAIVAIIVCSNAMITIPIARIVLKEKMDKKSWIPIIMAAIGIVIIFNPLSGGASGKGLSDHIIGVTLALLGAISISFFNVLATKTINKYGKAVTNSFSFFLGVAVMFICMLVLNIPIIKGIHLHDLALLLYVGIVVKGLGFLFFVSAMKETSAITATSVFYIKPILVPILMFLIMGQVIQPNVLVGTIIIVCSSLILYRIKKSNASHNLSPSH